MACVEMGEAMCKVYNKTIIVANYRKDCVGLGPMQCMLVKEKQEDDWTLFYSNIEGFDYEEGYEYVLNVQEEHLDPSTIPADASSIKWTLNNIVSISTEIPTSCATWFDGCNTCVQGENGNYACTEKACLGEPQKPYCMDDM